MYEYDKATKFMVE